VNLAGLQQKYGTYSDAEANLEKAHALDATSVVPVMLLAGLYENQKRYDDARKQFESAIQLEPKNPTPRKSLATLYFAQGQIEQTERVLTDAKNQMSDVPAGYRMLGDFYVARGDSAKAIAEFAALTASHPSDLGVQKTYAQLLVLVHKIDQALPVVENI